jgi:hypothetical protein
MAFAQRHDHFTRIAGEKAQMPDEFLTRSQILPGENVTFTYLPNWDILINAQTGGGGSSDALYQCCRRMMEGQVTMQEYSIYAFNETTDNMQIATDDMVNGSANARRHFGTAVYADIVHNFKLATVWTNTDPNHHRFLINLTDIRTGTTTPISMLSKPKVVGIDENTIRIMGTLVGSNIATTYVNGVALNAVTISGTNGSVASVSNIAIGMRIVGAGIPDDTYILTKDTGTNTFTVSQSCNVTSINTKLYGYQHTANTKTGVSPKLNFVRYTPRYHYTILEYTD